MGVRQNILRFSVSMLSALGLSAGAADAQPLGDIGVRGFAAAGATTFTAKDSFKTILGQTNGPIFGGGGQLLLPWGFYFEIGASRFKKTGERVFIGPNDEVFKLGIPVKVTVTPLQLTAGYRVRNLWRRFVPYGGVGYSRYRYKETSEFADGPENVDERFGGVHVAGGVEYLLLRWMAVGGEVSWASVADAIGKAGVSAHFKEDNLGGTSLRLKISVGR